MDVLHICLVLLWVFSPFLYMSHHFRRIQYFQASSSCFAGTGCLCCLLLHFHVILSVSLAFSRHLLGIFSACSWHMLSIVVRFLSISIYVPSCSKDSIYFKVSFSCFAGTGCLCCLLLYLGPDACVVYHCISICFLAFSWHSPGISLTFPERFLGILGIVVSFLRVPYIPKLFLRVLQGPDACAVDCCISMYFFTFPWHFLGISLAFLGIFLAFVWYCCEFSQDSYMRPIIFLGFHTFQGPFLVFWRDWMPVLFIVAFPCISWHFFSIFFAFP